MENVIPVPAFRVGFSLPLSYRYYQALMLL